MVFSALTRESRASNVACRDEIPVGVGEKRSESRDSLSLNEITKVSTAQGPQFADISNDASIRVKETMKKRSWRGCTRADPRACKRETFEIIALAQTLQTLNGFRPDSRTVSECE